VGGGIVSHPVMISRRIRPESVHKHLKHYWLDEKWLLLYSECVQLKVAKRLCLLVSHLPESSYKVLVRHKFTFDYI
jgi:hypothetical protein